MEFIERPVDEREGFSSLDRFILDAAANRLGCDLEMLLQDETGWVWADWLFGSVTIRVRFTYPELNQLLGPAVAQLNMGTDVCVVRAGLFSLTRAPCGEAMTARDLPCAYWALVRCSLTCETSDIGNISLWARLLDGARACCGFRALGGDHPIIVELGGGGLRNAVLDSHRENFHQLIMEDEVRLEHCNQDLTEEEILKHTPKS